MSHKIITIARQFGSGGHEVAQRLSDQLGIPLYDRNLVEMACLLYTSHGPDFHGGPELLAYACRYLIRITGGRDYDGIHRVFMEMVQMCIRDSISPMRTLKNWASRQCLSCV